VLMSKIVCYEFIYFYCMLWISSVHEWPL